MSRSGRTVSYAFIAARLTAHINQAEIIALVPGAIEIVEVGCFAIAALGMAAKKAIEQLPIAAERRAIFAAKFPRFFKSGNWNYAPLVLISIAIGLWIIQNVTGSGSDLERATVAPTEKPTAASSDNAQIVRLQSQVATLQSALAEKTHDLDVERQSKPSKSRLLQLDNAMKWRFVKALQDTARKKNGDIEACLAVVNIQRNSQYATALWEELQPIIYYAGWHNMGGGRSTPTDRTFASGVTILVGTDDGDAFTCGTALSQSLQAVTSIPVSMRKNQSTQDLTDCKNECVEIQVGDARPP